MTSIDGLNNREASIVNTFEQNKMDFISSIYLERGNMLDAEVRRLIGDIETSNNLIKSVDTLKVKSSIQSGEFETSLNYSKPTWQVSNDKTAITLDNGYKLSLRKNADGENFFVLEDIKGNQLIYQSQTLIPVPAGKTVDALKVGIPVMNDMTFVLGDGTEITLITADPTTAYNQSNLSGGLSDVANIVITRGNQGMEIRDFAGKNTPNVSLATVEVGENASTKISIPKTIPATPLTHHNVFDPPLNITPTNWVPANDAFDPNNQNELADWTNDLVAKANAMSVEEQTALLQAIKDNGGLDIQWQGLTKVSAKITGVLNQTNKKEYNLNQTYKYVPTDNESLVAFYTRITPLSSTSFKNVANNRDTIFNHFNDTFPGYRDYRDDGYGNVTFTREMQNLKASVLFPEYTFDTKISPEEKEFIETEGYTDVDPTPIETTTTGAISTTTVNQALSDHQNEALTAMTAHLESLSPAQEKALLEKLQYEGLKINWKITTGTDTTNPEFDKDYIYNISPGESLESFIQKLYGLSAFYTENTLKYVTGSDGTPNMPITTSITLPAYSFLDREGGGDLLEIPSHSLADAYNDGHVLLESNGLHKWEYDGVLTDNIQKSLIDEEGNEKVVENYHARKMAFSQSLEQQYFARNLGGVFITRDEDEMLRNILKINYKDTSGTGFLTTEEWALLKEALNDAKNNLIGSTQLQTVQLQRALTSHNHNFDQMSNSINRLYTLLKEINQRV